VEVEESVRLVEELRGHLEARDFEGLREWAERPHPADLAVALRQLPLDDRVAVFRQLTRYEGKDLDRNRSCRSGRISGLGSPARGVLELDASPP
jgi:hypothetical protein